MNHPPVPLIDLTRTGAAELDALREAFERVLSSGRYIMGPEVDALEAHCATVIGTNHALGVSSGTDALLLALMALDVGPGDEVVCPTFTFFATAGVVWRLGAKPVFADIDPTSFNSHAAELEPCLTPATKAVIPVHLYGQCAPMDEIMEVANTRGVAVVEDAAQAIGARHGDRQAGAFGQFGCFSFFPTKNIGCLGDAGLVVTDDAELAERARILRVHGGEPKYYHSMVGGNFRIDALQAALLQVRLRALDSIVAARRGNAARYRGLFEAAGIVGGRDEARPGTVELPAEIGPGHTYNQFVIRVFGDGARNALRAAMADAGVGTEIYYPVPLHLQECFRELGHAEGSFPHAERAANETLALPIFPELTPTEAERVVSVIAAWCRAR